MRVEPPFESTFNVSSASPFVAPATRNDTAGVNLKSGPADSSVNSCPARSIVTMSTEPEGVPSSAVVFLTFEPLNSDVYSRAASRASLSNQRCVVMRVFMASSSLRRILRVLRSRRIHEVPRLCARGEDVELGVEPARVVQARRGDADPRRRRLRLPSGDAR